MLGLLCNLPRAFLWNLLSADEEEETLVRLSLVCNGGGCTRGMIQTIPLTTGVSSAWQGVVDKAETCSIVSGFFQVVRKVYSRKQPRKLQMNSGRRRKQWRLSRTGTARWKNLRVPDRCRF